MAEKKVKKFYKKPKLKKIGTVAELTRTFSKGGSSDGGAFPNDKMMCISQPPHTEEHRVLVSDRVGQESFYACLKELVKPGAIVLDLGTGTGIHALFAAKLGASKVYAVDSHPMISTTREIAAKNNLSNKIEFIRGDSDQIELPTRVDLIVSNLGFLGSVEYLSDAISRFLKPGGIVIPEQVQLSFAAVEVPDYFNQHISFWDKPHFGFDMSPMKTLAVNHPLYLHLEEENLVSEGVQTQPVNFVKGVDKVTNFKGRINCARDAQVHGLGGWYSFFVNEKTFLSTKPPMSLNRDLWNNLLLPFSSPIAVKAGDNIDFEVSMYRDNLKGNLLWRWKISLNSGEPQDYSSFGSLL